MYIEELVIRKVLCSSQLLKVDPPFFLLSDCGRGFSYLLSPPDVCTILLDEGKNPKVRKITRARGSWRRLNVRGYPETKEEGYIRLLTLPPPSTSTITRERINLSGKQKGYLRKKTVEFIGGNYLWTFINRNYRDDTYYDVFFLHLQLSLEGEVSIQWENRRVGGFLFTLFFF